MSALMLHLEGIRIFISHPHSQRKSFISLLGFVVENTVEPKSTGTYGKAITITSALIIFFKKLTP